VVLRRRWRLSAASTDPVALADEAHRVESVPCVLDAVDECVAVGGCECVAVGGCECAEVGVETNAVVGVQDDVDAEESA
jgi:hypothetical protein